MEVQSIGTWCYYGSEGKAEQDGFMQQSPVAWCNVIHFSTGGCNGRHGHVELVHNLYYRHIST